MIIKKCVTIMVFIISSLSDNFLCCSMKQNINYSPKIINFIGKPGAGKGTLAGTCIKELKYTSLSVGNLLRAAVMQGTPIGKEIKSTLELGNLVPDELVTGLVEIWLVENLKKINNTIILEGFPRTARQAELFLDLLSTKFKNISFRVIDLNISDEIATRRLINRLICEKCQWTESKGAFCSMCGGKLIKRHDDREDIIPHRLKVYAENATEILNVYQKFNINIECIDVGNKFPQRIFNEFKELCDENVFHCAR